MGIDPVDSVMAYLIVKGSSGACGALPWRRSFGHVESMMGSRVVGLDFDILMHIVVVR